MTPEKMKLADMGTTGLEHYVKQGKRKGRRLRYFQASRVIEARHGEKGKKAFHRLIYGY